MCQQVLPVLLQVTVLLVEVVVVVVVKVVVAGQQQVGVKAAEGRVAEAEEGEAVIEVRLMRYSSGT